MAVCFRAGPNVSTAGSSHGDYRGLKSVRRLYPDWPHYAECTQEPGRFPCAAQARLCREQISTYSPWLVWGEPWYHRPPQSVNVFPSF